MRKIYFYPQDAVRVVTWSNSVQLLLLLVPLIAGSHPSAFQSLFSIPSKEQKMKKKDRYFFASLR